MQKVRVTTTKGVRVKRAGERDDVLAATTLGAKMFVSGSVAKT